MSCLCAAVEATIGTEITCINMHRKYLNTFDDDDDDYSVRWGGSFWRKKKEDMLLIDASDG